MKNIKSFIVEGNIGAGKSTFLRILQKRLAVDVVFEPLEKWQAVKGGQNLLDLFYKDTERWSYTFQSYAFVTRVLEQRKNEQQNFSGVQILERSVYSDRYCFAKNCFELGKMSTMEWQLYKEWFSWLVEGYTKRPDGFIYLGTDPDVCYERLLKRDRYEESAVPFKYLELLHRKHEDWLIEKIDLEKSFSEIPVLKLECNKEFENDIKEQDKHIEKIVSFFGLEEASPKDMRSITESASL